MIHSSTVARVTMSKIEARVDNQWHTLYDRATSSPAFVADDNNGFLLIQLYFDCLLSNNTMCNFVWLIGMTRAIFTPIGIDTRNF